MKLSATMEVPGDISEDGDRWTKDVVKLFATMEVPGGAVVWCPDWLGGS